VAANPSLQPIAARWAALTELFVGQKGIIHMYDQETGIFELETDKPLILLIGNIGHEGILSTLRAAGRQYKHKFLESRVKNWESILKYFDDYTIECVLVKLSPQAISLTTAAEYNGIREKVFRKYR
jgi:hypothetical protein